MMKQGGEKGTGLCQATGQQLLQAVAGDRTSHLAGGLCPGYKHQVPAENCCGAVLLPEHGFIPLPTGVSNTSTTSSE